VGVVVYVIDTTPHLMVSGKMVGLSPNPDLILPEVLASALSMYLPQKYLDDRTTGMAESQVNFTNDALLATPIHVPPLSEQRSISEILAAADKAIRTTEGIIAKLEQVKQGFLHDFLVLGIDDRGKIRDPKTHPDRFEMTVKGLIPLGWRITPLVDLV